MFVKFIKTHPSGFIEGRMVDLANDIAERMIKEGFAKESSQSEYQEHLAAIELANKKAVEARKEEIEAKERAAQIEIKELRLAVLEEIKAEDSEKAKAKAEAEAKAQEEYEKRTKEINEAAEKAKAEAEAKRIQALKESLKRDLLIERSTGTDIFDKYKVASKKEVVSDDSEETKTKRGKK